jgi:ankyrin repeat protein
MLDRAKDVITELGNASANVNAIDHLGSTPVHMAAGMGHARHLFFMCKFGFDPTLRNNVGQLAVDVARAQQKLK